MRSKVFMKWFIRRLSLTSESSIKDSFQNFRMSPRDVLNTSHVNL